MKTFLAAICIALSIQAGQVHAQTKPAREPNRMETDKKRLVDAQKAATDSNAYQSEEDNLNLGVGKMYNQLLTFRYIPSERDPFVSSSVISPFVTEEQIQETVTTRDSAKIKEAIGAIETSIRQQIQVQGISRGKTGANYTITNGQVLRPGTYLKIPLSDEARSQIDTATQIAIDAGGQVATIRFVDGQQETTGNPKTSDATVTIYSKPDGGGGLMVYLEKIDGNDLYFQGPSNTLFYITYKKNINLEGDTPPQN